MKGSRKFACAFVLSLVLHCFLAIYIVNNSQSGYLRAEHQENSVSLIIEITKRPPPQKRSDVISKTVDNKEVLRKNTSNPSSVAPSSDLPVAPKKTINMHEIIRKFASENYEINRGSLSKISQQLTHDISNEENRDNNQAHTDTYFDVRGDKIVRLGDKCFTVSQKVAEGGLQWWSLPRNCNGVKTQSEKMAQRIKKSMEKYNQ